MAPKMLLIALAISLTAGAVLADPNFYGQTGLTLNPTADIAEPDEIQARLSTMNQDTALLDGKWWAVSGNGIVSEKLELSLGYVNQSDVHVDDSGITPGLKFSLQPENEKSPAIALGGIWVSSMDQTGAYLVLSKTLSIGEEKMGKQPKKVRGHLGIRWDEFSGAADESDVTVFGGLNAGLGTSLSFEGEVGTRHNVQAETPWAALLKYQITRKTCVSAGMVQTGFSDDPEFIISLGRYGPIWR